MNNIKNNHGFTLIEIIASLIIVGIMASVAGMGIVQISKGYIFTRDNAATTQKGQLAMGRIIKEFSVIKTITTGSQNSINYTFSRDGTDVTQTLSLAGSLLQIDNITLTDNVSLFTLGYYDTYTSPEDTNKKSSTKIIEITLGLTGADSVVSTFKTRIRPRNIL